MNQLLKWISITDRFTKNYLDREFKELGLNSSQHMFLKHICRKEGIYQEDLYECVYVNKSNITRALVQLEQNGFIKRVQNPSDKRCMQLYPTKKAFEVDEKIQRIEEQWIEQLETNLDSEERAQLERLIEKVGHTAVEQLDLNKK